MVDQALRAALAPVADAKTLDTLFGNDADAVEALPDATKATLRDRLESLKTIDPACGSGAFPMGLLNRMVDLLGLLGDPRPDYERKLHLITQGIYGVDIQPIAIQISKLRFFISLLCDQAVKPNEPNFGLDQLPNLETHLVIADSLVWFQEDTDCLLAGSGRHASVDKQRVLELRQKLDTIRAKHIGAHSRPEKLSLRKEDERICKELRALLKALGFGNTEMLAEWNPYNPSVHAPFFDPCWMFGFATFDIVIGNPPYGIPLSKEEKAYVKAHYQSAKTIKGVQKGSMDSYSLFIERGFRLLHKGGTLVYIVPISITSSDSATGIHNLVMKDCAEIRVSSYAVRPQPVFENATVNTSILEFMRTGTLCEHIYSSKMFRKDDDNTISDILASLSFVEVKSLCYYGRIPKIGTEIERRILEKMRTYHTINDIIHKEEDERAQLSRQLRKEIRPTAYVYYRVVGGRYFKVITPYTTYSTKENSLPINDNEVVGACLSSNLGFWYYQIYSDNLSWPRNEIGRFPIPEMSEQNKETLRELYRAYLQDIEAHAHTYKTSAKSSYTMAQFKTYRIGLSKNLIDRIDDFIGPLYGLTTEEIDFIKNYELAFRLADETSPTPSSAMSAAGAADEDEEEA